MKIFIIGLVFIISLFLSFSHNPLSARYYLEAGEHASLLTINLSQDGVNQALLKKYGKERLVEINPIELEESIVNYIKSNFNLSFDKKEIELKKGGIKLGSHQTDLKFVLSAFSKKVERIDIHIPAFKENDNHQTIFSYNMKGSTDHVILSLHNNYQSTIMFPTSAPTNSWRWFILIALISLISIILLSSKEPSFSILTN